MSFFEISFRKVLLGAIATCFLGAGHQAVAAEPAAPTGDYSFVEGNAAQLGGVKRVIISNFVVVFQLDGSMRNDNATKVGNMTFFGGNTKEVSAKMAWDNPDAAAMQQIADAGLAALKADFKAKGIEVLDESVLAGQPAHKSILEATGLKNLEDYSILNVTEAVAKKGSGDVESVSEAKIASANGLAPYGHSVFEGGLCCHVRKGYPSSKAYYVPGYEIDIAKALDAAVVKVWQYVYFTQVDAGVRQEGWAGGVGGATVNYSASAKSVVRIGEQKTRMSFRLPASKNKKKSAASSWMPLDGDVVVSLSRPVLIGDQYYNVADSGKSVSLGGTQRFSFAATLSNPDAYQKDVAAGVGTVLSGLVNTALGQ